MTPNQALAKAERCFAVARSTTFEGERANAIARGIRIAQRAKLDLNDFDIPGRERSQPSERSESPREEERDRQAHRTRSEHQRGPDTNPYRSYVEEVLKRFSDGFAVRSEEVGLRPGETIYDARRRNFDAAAAAAAEHDRQKEDRVRRERLARDVADAVRELTAAGWTIYQNGPGLWAVIAPAQQSCDFLTDQELVTTWFEEIP